MTLIVAPWAYGGTTVASIKIIILLLEIVIGLWGVELLVRRRWPEIPTLLIVASTALLALGWFMAWNAGAVYDTEFQSFSPTSKIIALAPSSVDQATSTAWMIRVSVLLGALLFVTDLSNRLDWTRRIWVALGAAGGSIALLGLLQRATGAVLPFWEYRPWEFSTFFATYYYHANAGAFLNLVLPLAAGLALRSFARTRQPVQRAIWLAVTFLILVAVFVNTSRVAQLLSGLTLAALVMGPARRPLIEALRGHRSAVLIVLTTTFVVLIVAARPNIAGTPAQRWHQVTEQIPKDARWAAYRIALQALPDAGWTGFGPGTFRLIFPEYERLHAVEEPGQWQSLHQDYLQTILEWGWTGAACWAVVLFGGIAVAIRGLGNLRRQSPGSRPSRALPLVLIALGTVLLHSLVDFPLQVASLQLYAATYLGICWSACGTSGRLAHK